MTELLINSVCFTVMENNILNMDIILGNSQTDKEQ